MVKSRIRTRKNIKRRTKNNKKNKNMKGGAYTQEQEQQLLDEGFTPFFLKIANSSNIGFNILWSDFQQSHKPAQQYMQETYDELNIHPDDELTDYESGDDEQAGGKKRKSKKTRKNNRRKYK